MSLELSSSKYKDCRLAVNIGLLSQNQSPIEVC